MRWKWDVATVISANARKVMINSQHTKPIALANMISIAPNEAVYIMP
jgi:hypothetical protein